MHFSWGSPHTRGYRTEQSQQHRHLVTQGHLLQLSPIPGPEMWQHLSTPSPSSSSPGSLLHPASWAGGPSICTALKAPLLRPAPPPLRPKQMHPAASGTGRPQAHPPLPTPLLAPVYHTAYPSQQLMRHCWNKHILKIIIPQDLVCITQESGLAQLQSRGQSKKCMESAK